MRTFVCEPADETIHRERKWGGLICYSEIFQITPPIERFARHFAAQGYIVMAPEIYHDDLPPGSPLGYDDHGKNLGNELKKKTRLSSFDESAAAVVEALHDHPRCNGRVGAVGVCIGGHLALRAAFHPEVLASVCFFPTDVHTGTLGRGENADTLERLNDIQGELALIFGRQDPHVPAPGRLQIYRALQASTVKYSWHEFNAQHAFMRDEGYRYDAGLARLCRELAFDVFHRNL
jgi:carboxymethylenebutenolidase